MKQSAPEKYIAYIAVCICLFFSSSSFILIPAFNHWHDQQRVAQIILCAACALTTLYIDTPYLPRLANALLFSVFFLGGISAISAAYPMWALYEWATLLGLFCVVLTIRHISALQPKYSEYILAILTFAAVANSLQFITAYLASIFSGLHNLDAYLLYSGFSNPRFLNQFQALALPVLGYLFLTYSCKHFPYAKLLTAIVLISLLTQWVIAFTLGGRGLWLAMAASNIMLTIFFPRYWRLLAVQLAAGLAAWLLYYLMFTLVPAYLEITPRLWDNLRSGLSARETIWQLAWDIFKAHPWLGAGPMHFSAYANPIAAHPHQVILQWLAEWGLIATLAAVTLASWGMLSGLKHIRQQHSKSLDTALWMSLLNAFFLAQVDGVFVMPYTVTWLAILIGLAWARWSNSINYRFISNTIFWKTIAIFCLIILLHSLFITTPKYLHENNHATIQENDFAPRFWAKGFIPP